MKLIEISVKRPLATLMVFLGVVLLGFISLKHLRVDLLPDLGYPKLSVVTEYLGASSGEVESLVTTHLEASLSPIPGVKRVSSVSREGVSLVTLEFHWGTDMNFALLHTKEKVEEARSLLPEDCPAPRLIELDPGAKPIVIAVLGVRPGERRTLAELRETAESLVKPRLEQLAGVSKVDVQGGGEREVAVVLDPSKLALYHIGYDQVAKAIQDWNQVVLGGTVKRDKVRYVVKVEGEIPRVEDLASIPVDTGGQAPLTIGDLGRARLAEKVRQGDIRFAGRSTVALMVYKESSSNTVQACAEVRKACAAMEREFPDLRFHTVSEEAGLILSAIANLKQSLIQGGFLAFLVLLIFFQNLRDPILVVLISPISILATFALMYFSGITLNIMSLGGLALGVGMFMDNAIVVIENMFRLERQGDPETAAIAGTRELMPALLGSTLTTMVIFLPVIYIYGISGRLFRDQSLTICYALTVALVVTVTLLPSLFRLLSAPNRAPLPAGEPEGAAGNRWLRVAHGLLALPFRLLGFVLTTTGGAVAWLAGRLRHGLDRALRRPLGFVCRGFNREYERFAEGYHRFLVRCLERKSIAAWITLAMFAGALGFYLLLKKELLPPTSSDRFEVMVTTRAGQGYEETEALGLALEREIGGWPGVRGVFARLGATSKLGGEGDELSVNQIGLVVQCRGRSLRDPLMARARGLLARSAGIDRFSVFPERNSLSEYLRFGAEAFVVKVFYERVADGRQVAGQVAAELGRLPGVAAVGTDTEEGKPLLALKTNDSLLRSLGLDKGQVVAQVGSALRGRKVSTMKDGQRSYDILLTSPLRDSREWEGILAMPVLAGNTSLPLRQLVDFTPRPTVKEIHREAQERLFTVSADLAAGGNGARIAARLNRVLGKMALPAGVRVVIGGEEAERRTAFRSVAWALLLSVLLVYMVMAAEFENLIHPLIIMLTVPMGLLGAFFLLFVLGESINVISGIGMMVAVGVVVDDAIVKLETTNQFRAQGFSVREALLRASRLRLKPIILNSLTTIFGVLPMITMSGVGTELQRPMAVVMAGGLLSSTVLTLILIPVLYELVSRDKPS